MLKRVVAVMSGGLDSFCYAMMWKEIPGVEIYPIVFDYGQKGRKEIAALIELLYEMSKTDPTIKPPKLVNIAEGMATIWTNNQLTDPFVHVEPTYQRNVVVPLRNAVFLTIASTYAHSIGAKDVIYGAHLDDVMNPNNPLYPDCSPQFTQALGEALAIGHLDGPVVKIHSPAMYDLHKSDLLKEGFRIGGPRIFETWSCYHSGTIHCGKCESCMNRKNAFAVAKIEDLTPYAE